MAISTYSELQAFIAGHVDRSDLDSVIPDFIAMAEPLIKSKIRTMTEEVRARASTTGDVESVQLPDYFNGMRNIFVMGNPKVALTQVAADVLRRSNAGQWTGKPEMYAVTDNHVIFAPVPDGEYDLEMDYYEFKPLSDSVTINSVLTNYPDIYIYLALAETYGYLKDDDREVKALARAKSAIESAITSDRRVRYGTSPLRTIAQ